MAWLPISELGLECPIAVHNTPDTCVAVSRRPRGGEQTPSWRMMDARTEPMPATRRVVTVNYEAVEFQELMSAKCLERIQELGYLAVVKGEEVWVWEATKTHGHGGNIFDSYTFSVNNSGDMGWLPDDVLAGEASPDAHAADALPADALPADALPDALAADAIPDALVADYTPDAADLYATDGWEELFSC